MSLGTVAVTAALCPGEKKKNRGKYIFAFSQVEIIRVSFCRVFRSGFLKPGDCCRVDACKPLCQRPISLWRLTSSPPGLSEGWWDLGTPREAGREGWVLSSEVFGVFCFVFNLLQLCFLSLLCQGVSIQV